MKVFLLSFLVFGLSLTSPRVQAVEPASNIPELSTLLSLFSAHANATDGVRLNWTLDKQSPLITGFRIYRGYEEVGNFAVLTEVPVRPGTDVIDYAFTDTLARGSVTYFYKIAALGQKSESVFPVVITATRPLPGEGASAQDLAPLSILKGDKIALYVRNGGHVKLEITLPRKTLVDDDLKPGIYEFDPPAGGKAGLKLHVENGQGYTTDVIWPLH